VVIHVDPADRTTALASMSTTGCRSTRMVEAAVTRAIRHPSHENGAGTSVVRCEQTIPVNRAFAGLAEV
jgi:hypothetical protein